MKNDNLPCTYKDIRCINPRAKNQSYCSEHRREYERAWKKTDKGKIKNRADAIKRLYNITLEDYDKRILEPCQICHMYKLPIKIGKYVRSQMHLDHDHTTGKVRGTLCNNCNVSLGGFMDSIELLESAIRYLEQNNVP